jgi:hypothetical protein
MKKCFWFGILLLAVPVRGATTVATANPTLTTTPDYSNILVGIHYFGGWWEPGVATDKGVGHSKWTDPRDGHDWRPDYPGRVPTTGVDNNEATMTKEIAAAADHGVDYFAILWYPRLDPKPMRDVSTLLDRSVGDFVHAPDAGRMKFYVELCNGGQFNNFTAEQWREWIPEWVRAMKSPSYLRVDGRLVFVLHDGNSFFHKVCHGDLKEVQARLDELRAKVRRAGLGDLVIGGGNIGPVAKGSWSTKVYDFTTNYMFVPDLAELATLYPYPELDAYLVTQRHNLEKDATPYLPPLAAGWDALPWHGEHRPSFLPATRAEWLAALRSMANDLEASKNLGIPRRDGTVEKSFVIYAWNEFGEGGIMAPTVGEGSMKLEGIATVFGVKDGAKK